MSESCPSKQDTIKTQSTPSIKQKKRVVLETSDSVACYRSGKLSKSGKKNLSKKEKVKAKPKKKGSSRKPNPPESSFFSSGDYSQRGSFYFTQKAKHRFSENYNISKSGDDFGSESKNTPGMRTDFLPVPRTDLHFKSGRFVLYEQYFCSKI